MGRVPCCDEVGVKKGPWTQEEDKALVDYIQKNGGHGSWRRLPKLAGLNRCGKSCRLRWTNYLRPDIKRGQFSDDEEKLIIDLHSVLGNKWSSIALRLPGRTDNEIKNYWNTHLRKKLLGMGIDPVTHRPRTDLNLFSSNLPCLIAAAANLTGGSPLDSALRLHADATNLAKLQLMQSLLHVLGTTSSTATATSVSPSFDLMYSSMAAVPGHMQQTPPGQDLAALCATISEPPAETSSVAGFTSMLNNLQSFDPCTVTPAGLFGEGGPMLPSVMAALNGGHLPALDEVAEAGVVSVSSTHGPVTSSEASSVGASTSLNSSALEGFESFNLDDMNSDVGWNDWLQQMSWMNTP